MAPKEIISLNQNARRFAFKEYSIKLNKLYFLGSKMKCVSYYLNPELFFQCREKNSYNSRPIIYNNYLYI